MAAALALAATTTAAQAAKPVSKDRQAAMAKIAKNHQNFRQPKTMADAARTEVRNSNGVAVAVPAELWNELSVQTDAQGKVQVHEADATGVAVTVEGDANE